MVEKKSDKAKEPVKKKQETIEKQETKKPKTMFYKGKEYEIKESE